MDTRKLEYTWKNCKKKKKKKKTDNNLMLFTVIVVSCPSGQMCREEENLVFWFGAQFISTLNFNQSG